MQICPYCNKVKALLDLHRVPYETTEVNPLTKREIKEWSGGYRKVPIAVLAGEQVNDSAVIATTLMDQMEASGVLSAKELAGFRSPKALEWAEWSDRQLAVLLFPNITRSFNESYEEWAERNLSTFSIEQTGRRAPEPKLTLPPLEVGAGPESYSGEFSPTETSMAGTVHLPRLPGAEEHELEQLSPQERACPFRLLLSRTRLPSVRGWRHQLRASSVLGWHVGSMSSRAYTGSG